VFDDYRYTAFTGQVGAPEIVSPSPQSRLTDEDVRFEWTGGIGVLQFTYSLGTTPGATDLGQGSAGLRLWVMIAGVPADARPKYFRLYYLVAGLGWLSKDIVFGGR